MKPGTGLKVSGAWIVSSPTPGQDLGGGKGAEQINKSSKVNEALEHSHRG